MSLLASLFIPFSSISSSCLKLAECLLTFMRERIYSSTRTLNILYVLFITCPRELHLTVQIKEKKKKLYCSLKERIKREAHKSAILTAHQTDALICFSSVTSQAVRYLAAKFISYEVINKAGQSQ